MNDKKKRVINFFKSVKKVRLNAGFVQIHLEHAQYTTGSNNHFKHNHRKEVLGAAGIESTPVRPVDNNRAAKHEATMLVCLMFSCLFFKSLLQ